MKLYSDLAEWWPLMSAPEDYEEEAAFYGTTLAAACSAPPITVLELGSGGGNNASYLKARFTMTLVDPSAAMLAVSRWHRVRSDEVWQYAEGAPLDLWITPPSFERVDRIQLGTLTEGATPTHVVPAGWWQAARTTGTYSLVNCIVGPGFEFVDFEFLADDPGRVDVFRRIAGDAARFL